MVALKRLTLAEQAYEELQEQIVSGRLPAGQRLLADELADAMAISQTPVKEALARLELDGLVEGAGNTMSPLMPLLRTEFTETRSAAFSGNAASSMRNRRSISSCSPRSIFWIVCRADPGQSRMPARQKTLAPK